MEEPRRYPLERKLSVITEKDIVDERGSIMSLGPIPKFSLVKRDTEEVE